MVERSHHVDAAVPVASRPSVMDTVLARAGFRPTHPTDRGALTPLSGVGIDTVYLTGPTTEQLLFELSNQQVHRAIDRGTGELTETAVRARGQVEVGFTRARVSGFRQRGVPMMGVELSLPCMIHGHNRNAIDAADLEEFADAVLCSLTWDLPDVPDVDQVTLARLDIVSDFHGVESPSWTLTQVSRHPVARARHHEQHVGADGKVQTLTRGSKTQWLIRGYDKEQQLAALARDACTDSDLLNAWAAVSSGMLRVELQLRGERLRRDGITMTKDARPTLLEGLAQKYFVRGRFDVISGGLPAARHLIEQLSATGVSDADLRVLSSYLLSDLLDTRFPGERKLKERGRALARRHGLTGSTLLDPDEPRRLDFDSRSELRGEAALRHRT
ncbi:hypothetical protein GTQ99_05810 [Kineococcus sp. T13]|uniref:hypothetical protein n=1 Tax=Kineococcus vitellinus TaxID=2696565 RepID=UPI001412C026|nr:hypothetical protein [Kineococcus vitellinus]NAZ74939.1 hypothetical protein [Kineococcus vitellinus]